MEKQPMHGSRMGQPTHSAQQRQPMGEHQATLYEQAPATQAMRDYNHNLIQMLSEKLDSVWRYEKYIQDAPEDSCRRIYEQLMKADTQAIGLLRDEISRHCQQSDWR